MQRNDVTLVSRIITKYVGRILGHWLESKLRSCDLGENYDLMVDMLESCVIVVSEVRSFWDSVDYRTIADLEG